MTRRLVVIAVLLLIATAAGWATRSVQLTEQETEASTPRQPLSVNVLRIEAVDHVNRKREYTGELRAARVSDLSFERPGRLLEVTVDEGDAVDKGQLIARIDVAAVAAQIKTVEAQLDQANAVLDELVQGPRQETIDATRAKVTSLDAQVEKLRRDFARAEKLVESNSISRQLFDADNFALQSSIADRNAVQEQLAELLSGTRKEKLTAQRAVVRQFESQLETLRLDFEDGELRAPFAGRIAERTLDEGTVVAAGAKVFRLVEDSQLEAWIGIPPAAARQLKESTTYQLTVANQTVFARLSSLRPQLNPVTRTQNVILKIDPASARELVPGQIARLSLSERLPAAGFLLPTSTLIPGPRGLWNVFVLDRASESEVQQRSVELLYTLGEESLVTGTLSVGDLVVVDGVHRIVPGQEVAIVETPSETQQ